MRKSTAWLFDTNTTLSNITINSLYHTQIMQLFECIASTMPPLSKENILLNYWTYRLYDDVIIHALDFMTLSHDLLYTLTATESDTIHFLPHSFTSNQGSITVIDSVDINGLIHYLYHYFKQKGVQFNFSFLNKSM
ncbi:hypothetical protein [Pasteurella oralis]|uniref:hypothetical protein n=1 Tax=Pasteurella oralis TaxID=1071947 RepID=UPI000C7DBBE8|nr:hypothetical protein [Pasteurella oralis]